MDYARSISAAVMVKITVAQALKPFYDHDSCGVPRRNQLVTTLLPNE